MPGWHSRYRRPAGQPASEAAPASVPSSSPTALTASCAHPEACLYSPRRPPPDRPTTPSRACPSGPVPRLLLRSPHTSAQPQPASFLLHLPITGLGKGQPVGMAQERSKGTCESGSKARVGISSVGVSRAEPGLGLTSAGLGAADAAQAGGLGQGGRAQRLEHSCSPPLHETLPSSQGPQEQGAYLGKAGLCRSACPRSRCWAGHAGTGGRGQLSPAGSSAHTPPNRPSLPSTWPHFPLRSQSPSPSSSASSPCSLTHSGPSQVSCGLCPMGK